ncbi:hypothetical protein SporoP37_02790 [Sporosarcina sp. P37]|uniref:DUF6509 family protein n=1 Tax=unclassified Sporosarcina TaxID=2647733 RepID=UPI000A179FD4|nr:MULTISPECIES: DUF6509 family protein [unclassified Sporosarcina]ARK23724.1 hypothetical protein SporoP37_02790 [Sporosarcina sp. P37]PID18870.1 pullulanase [Sporosarcina sp. P35]
MQIVNGTVEELIDPTGIIEGQRYEVLLTVKVDEEDELFNEEGTGLRMLYSVKDGQRKMLTYQFYELATGSPFDVEWDEEEQAAAEQYSTGLFPAL